MKTDCSPIFVKKRDFIIIIVIAAIALAGLAIQKSYKSGSKFAHICVDGKAVRIIELEGALDSTFSIDEINGAEFEIKNGRIRIKVSDCSDKICQNTGFISNTGESIVCLPKKLTVVIKSQGDSEQFDAIIG